MKYRMAITESLKGTHIFTYVPQNPLVNGENGTPFYRIALSIEKDPIACQTLKLRHFLRQFPPRDLPPEYYGYLRQQKNPEEIYRIKKYATQALKADESVWHVELGGNSAVDAELDRRIADILKGNDKWVLIGGPPCQNTRRVSGKNGLQPDRIKARTV